MMQKDDVIHFGDGLCVVISVDCEDPYLDESVATLVTEGECGGWFVDYVDPKRKFSIARNV